MIVPPIELQEIDRLQELNLNLKAYQAAKPFGPLSEWEGTEALIIASHLAYSLGAPNESFRLTSRAWHRNSDHPKAIFYYAIELFQRRGPLPALMFMRRFSDYRADDKLTSWWFSLLGQLHSSLRDFSVAEKWHSEAIAAAPDEPWVWISKSFSFEQQDKFDEALEAAQTGLDLAPNRRSTVSATAHFLTLLERNEEALNLISDVIEKVENAWLVKQLAELQSELGMHADAYSTLQKCFDLLPLLEEKTGEWLYGGLSDSAHLIGDTEKALEYAEKASNPFHKKIQDNLKNAPEGGKRIVLDVGFLRQHHVTCAPATLSNIARYWKRKADHLELVDVMCYDGTPSYKERIWAESNGWKTKEFTLNWEDATSLLDRGVPLTLATIYPGGGHLQAIIGYDGCRRTYLIRDPYFQRTQEFLADELLEQQKSSGPRVMAMVPNESGDLLNGLNRELFESEIYDLLYEVESALESHRRPEAAEALKTMEKRFPDHRLTISAHWTISNYDTNTHGVHSALQKLLTQFPDDVNLRLNDISISAGFTSRIERIEKLERYSKSEKTDPLMWQMFGYEMGLDATQHRRALHWLFRSIRRSPGNGLTYRFIADILWAQRRFEEATELYRFAASLNDKDEQFAYSYFLAMRYLRREDEAVTVLSDRFKRFGKQSGLPVRSLFSALRELGRIDEAFEGLDQALKLRSDDGDLILYVADTKARYGRIDEADELLASAKDKASEPRWLRAAASVAQIKGEPATALMNWREVLAGDPSAYDAHENIAYLIKGLEGTNTAKEHLRQTCRRFPSNRSLQILRLQHLDEEPGEAIAILRDLIRLDPGDIWSLRELSHWYAQVGKFDRSLEAAEQALAIDPNDATSHWFLGRAKELQKNYSEAGKAYRSAIELSVDNTYAISSCIGISRTIESKRAVLDFVWKELNKQVSIGDGLFAYRDESRRVTDRVSLLQNLQDYAATNRRSWFATSAVIQQLADMGKTDEAVELALEATQRFPLVHQTWLDLSVVYKLIGNFDGETEALSRAVSINPVWSYGVQQLAEAYQRAGRFEESRDVLTNALARMPFDNFLLGYLADAYWNLGDGETALETAKRAVMIEPDYQWAWAAIKRWAGQTGNHELPAVLARELTQKKPKDIRVWINLAEMLEAGIFSQEQLDAVEQALKLDPFSPTALAMKANALSDIRQFDKAIEVAKTKMPDGHRPEQLRYVEAGIEAMRGNTRRSVDILVELTESSPGYLPGWSRLADIYRTDAERSHEYRKTAMEMVRLAPREATVYGYLAEACLKMDLKDEARDALEQAVILDPAYEYAVANLFDLLLEANDLHEAERIVETVVSASPATGLPIAVELTIRKNDKTDTLKSLNVLLKNKDIARERLDGVFEKAVGLLGNKDNSLLDMLREVTASEEVNPVTGRYLIDAAWKDKKKKGCEAALESISGKHLLWAYAASRYIEILTAEKPTAVKKFIDSNAEKLAAETESWGSVGYHLSNTNDPSRMTKWFAGWEKREDLMPWMLWNYSIVLLRSGKLQEAEAVNTAALELRYDDTVNLHLTMLGLTEFNRRNFDQAAAIFSGINPSSMTSWDRFFYDILQEAVWATERLKNSEIDAAKAIVESIAENIVSFDPRATDKIVRQLAAGALNSLLESIGNTWFSLRIKGKLLLYRFW